MVTWFQDILRNISQKNYAVLFDHEQLKREKDKGKIFVDFGENHVSVCWCVIITQGKLGT